MLSLVWSIVYVAGKGLMEYIHVQTMLLLGADSMQRYTLKCSARIRIRAHSTERVNDYQVALMQDLTDDKRISSDGILKDLRYNKA